MSEEISWDASCAILESETAHTHFGPISARIFDCLWRRGFVGGEELVSFAYADDPNGGPEFAQKSLHTLVHNLRPHIEPFGLSIQSFKGRGGGYRLVGHKK